MTLRVTLEIVPCGLESSKSEIGRFDISNTGPMEGGDGLYCYVVKPTITEGLGEGSVRTPLEEYDVDGHDRSDGAVALVREVLSKFKGEF